MSYVPNWTTAETRRADGQEYFYGEGRPGESEAINPPLVKVFSKTDRNGKLTVFRFYEGRQPGTSRNWINGINAFAVECTEVLPSGKTRVSIKEHREYSDCNELALKWEDWVTTRLGCSLQLPNIEDLSSRKERWGAALVRGIADAFS